MTSQTDNKPFHGIRTVVTTPVSFDEVCSRLREQMGSATVQEIVALAQTLITQADYIAQVQERFVGPSGFMRFAQIDHGNWLPVFGIHRRSLRWVLGNPLIAMTMIRHDITAGLFAPVEILITEAQDGTGTSVTYVRPSSQMVIESNPPLLAAAVVLDVKLDQLITQATS
ncbi:MAG: DUF302 domain-containing protein [Sphingomonadales bacterium]|nr:DUF302 domain-containing protein [Sphingomonadales bacterium]MDE2169229.1 DUF302 domain-containing protein [Sphingomonadales bacterium]